MINKFNVGNGELFFRPERFKTNVLELNNTSDFTPNADYEPATKKYVDDHGPNTYSVGDFAHGGVVFWVDDTGEHGLVCAKEDQNEGEPIQWYNGTNLYTGAHADGIYSGRMNTWLIIAAQGVPLSDYAAGVCADLRQTENGITYGDWYLPSSQEMGKIWENRVAIDATAIANGGSALIYSSTAYWTSCEMTDALAVVRSFTTGFEDFGNKYYLRRVRAVRSF